MSDFGELTVPCPRPGPGTVIALLVVPHRGGYLHVPIVVAEDLLLAGDPAIAGPMLLDASRDGVAEARAKYPEPPPA